MAICSENIQLWQTAVKWAWFLAVCFVYVQHCIEQMSFCLAPGNLNENWCEGSMGRETLALLMKIILTTVFCMAPKGEMDMCKWSGTLDRVVWVVEALREWLAQIIFRFLSSLRVHDSNAEETAKVFQNKPRISLSKSLEEIKELNSWKPKPSFKAIWKYSTDEDKGWGLPTVGWG